MHYFFALLLLLALPHVSFAESDSSTDELELNDDFFKCKLNSSTATIWFDTEGVLACNNIDVHTIPQKASLKVGIITIRNQAAKYILRYKPGDTRITGSIRGLEHLAGKFKMMVSPEFTRNCVVQYDLEPAKKNQSPCYYEWRILDTFKDGFSTTDFSLTITATTPSPVSQSATFKVEQGYYLNVGLLGTLGLYRDEEYKVSNSRIRKEFNDNPLNFYGGVHLYVGSLLQGRPRYFENRSLVNSLDKLSMYVGVDLTDPRDGAAVGLAYDFFEGANLAVVWQPHRTKTLDGLSTGSSFEGDDPPMHDRWTGKWTNVGIGISIDTSILKTFDKD